MYGPLTGTVPSRKFVFGIGKRTYREQLEKDPPKTLQKKTGGGVGGRRVPSPSLFKHPGYKNSKVHQAFSNQPLHYQTVE